MQIVFHIGANCTDDDRLLKSLMKNADTFDAHGVRVPGPGRYRKLMRDAINGLSSSGGNPAPGAREELLDAVLEGAPASRLVMSNASFVCVPPRVFLDGGFFPQAEGKIGALTRLFAGDELEIALAVMNPATFVPALYERVQNEDFATFMNGVDPREIRWAPYVERIRAIAPNAGITVWCNEDTPLIWGQLIRELSGLDPFTPILGGFDLVATIMSTEGMKRMLAYLKSNPPQNEDHKRRIIAAFLDKFALADVVEEELNLPGWTHELVDDLTAAYEEDVYEISRMEGVTLITP